MRVVEETGSAGNRPVFDLSEFLARPLFAHLAHGSEHGAGVARLVSLERVRRVGDRWGVVPDKPQAGAAVRDRVYRLRSPDRPLPPRRDAGDGRGAAVRRGGGPGIFHRYMGPEVADWDRRFDDVFDGSAKLELVRLTPETVVVRDQSYRPTR